MTGGAVRDGVGSLVGGTNWVGVGSKVSVGRGATLGGAVAVAMAVAVDVGVTNERVAVATKRWRVGLGVAPCGSPTIIVATPRM